jgi:hypothetical protein
MATDTLTRSTAAAAQCARSRLVTQLQEHSRAVIAAELRRLGRTAPSLGTGELRVVAAALEELTEAVLLARLRRAPPDDAAVLAHLFSPGKEP